MPRARSPIEDLRLAIDCLPVRTRRAMLEGIRSCEIIVGAYADRAGGVCPMLAAYRCGGRTSFVSFARAWDRFAGARRARRATPRELRILEGQLEASLLAEERFDLGAAIAEHEALRARGASGDEGDDGRADERPAPRRRDRWAWLRPGRRSADDERALRRLETELAALRAAAGAPGEPPRVEAPEESGSARERQADRHARPVR
jgi:hypothetical protein